jgi:hypothetical protein
MEYSSTWRRVLLAHGRAGPPAAPGRVGTGRFGCRQAGTPAAGNERARDSSPRRPMFRIRTGPVTPAARCSAASLVISLQIGDRFWSEVVVA